MAVPQLEIGKCHSKLCVSAKIIKTWNISLRFYNVCNCLLSHLHAIRTDILFYHIQKCTCSTEIPVQLGILLVSWQIYTFP